MADQVSNLTIKIGSTGDFAAFNAARQQAEMLKASVTGLREVLGTLGVGLSIGGFLELGEKMLSTAASIKRLSEQAGMSTQAFQTMSMVAIEAGMDNASLAQTLEFLRKSMGLAEDGASKQNKAIAELGLNTADLLALPADKQVEAIAKAYAAASDKGKAWNDVVVLLGRNAAHLQQVLDEYATKGADALDRKNAWWRISDDDLDRWEKLEVKMKETWMVSQSVGIKIADALTQMNPAKFLADLIPGGAAAYNVAKVASDYLPPPEKKTPDGKPSDPANHDSAGMKAQVEAANKAAAIRLEMAATLEALPAMAAAHEMLTKALEDENAAYKSNGEKAATLRAEAAQLEAKSKGETGNPADFEAHVQSVKDEAAASKLRAEANKLDAETEKGLTELRAKNAAFDAKAVSEAEQLKASRIALAAIEAQINSLDAKSLSFKDDELRLGKESLAAREQIRVEEEKIGEAEIKGIEIKNKAADKQQQIALASIEHDWTTTDNEKWAAKVALMEHGLAILQAQQATMQKIADDTSKPEGERGKAKDAASGIGEKVDAQQVSLAGVGPDPTKFTQQFQADITKLRSSWGSLQQQMASGLTGVITSGLDSVESNIDKLVMKTETWKQAMLSVATTIESALVQSFVKMAVQWVASQIMMAVAGKSISAASAAANVPIATAEALMWAPAATLATIASFGGAAVAAPVAIMAAMASTESMALFEQGGYTGGREGMAAGVVHGQEYVFPAPAVRAIGLDNLDAMHRAAISPASYGSAVAGASGGGRRDGGNIHLHLHTDEVAALRAASKTREGRQIIGNLASGKVREYRR